MSTILNRPTKDDVKRGNWAELVMLADIFRGKTGAHCGYRIGTRETITVTDGAGNDITHTEMVFSDAVSARKQWPGKGEDARKSVVTGDIYSRRTAARAARVVDLIQTHAPDMTEEQQIKMVNAVRIWVNADLPDDEYLTSAIADNRPSLISDAMVESRKLARADKVLAGKVARANRKVSASGTGAEHGDAESPRSTSVGDANSAPATVTVTVAPTLDMLVTAIREYGAHGVSPADRLALIQAVESLALTAALTVASV